MNFALDVFFASFQEVITTFFSSIFLVPLTIFSETIIRLFTGGA